MIRRSGGHAIEGAGGAELTEHFLNHKVLRASGLHFGFNGNGIHGCVLPPPKDAAISESSATGGCEAASSLMISTLKPAARLSKNKESPATSRTGRKRVRFGPIRKYGSGEDSWSGGRERTGPLGISIFRACEHLTEIVCLVYCEARVLAWDEVAGVAQW